MMERTGEKDVRNDVTLVSDGQEENENALRVEIQCIIPPSAEQLEKIKRFMQAEYHTDPITFVIKKDPSVVGGFRIFVGDDNYDWSTQGRIRQLRRRQGALRGRPRDAHPPNGRNPDQLPDPRTHD